MNQELIQERQLQATVSPCHACLATAGKCRGLCKDDTEKRKLAAPSIKSGQKNTSPSVASLIYQSSHELLDFMFGNPENATRMLSALCSKKGGHFGYQFLSTLELEGETIGAELGYTLPQLKSQEFMGGLQLLLNTSASNWWHLLRTVSKVVDHYVPPPSSGSYYINNLAVLPEHRGKGFGKRLLLAAINRAKESDCQTIDLDVTAPNSSAIAFYESLGFREASRTQETALTRKHHLPVLIRMVKAL